MDVQSGGATKRSFIQRRTELCVKICRTLYRNVHGRELSIKYRKEVADMSDPTLTFGEIVPQSFLQILNFTSDVTRPAGRKFVDLGSGTGRACMCAALSPYGFSTVIGIELMPDLHQQSVMVKNCLHDMLEKPCTSNVIVKSKSTSKSKHVPKDIDSVANVILSSGEPILMDQFANAISKEMGHKEFKAAVKPFKTFARYVKEKTSICELSADGKVVQGQRNTLSSSQTDESVISTVIEESGVVVQLEQGEGEAGDKGSEIDREHYDYKITVDDVPILSPLPEIAFLNGDMFTFEWWEDTDVMYAASLLFSESMMEKLTVQASRMKSGSWVISLKPLLLGLNKDLLEAEMVLRSESFYKMSWQMAKVYIYQVL